MPVIDEVQDSENKKPRSSYELRGLKMIPAITYFRTCGHYHRPGKLNCRVRNGNECGLPGIVTGNSQVGQLKENLRAATPAGCHKKGSGRVAIS